MLPSFKSLQSGGLKEGGFKDSFNIVKNNNTKLTICLSCGLNVTAKAEDAPEWSPAFSVTGVLYIPYAELTEPFSAYFDMSVGSSRIDYYGGLYKTLCTF